MKKRSLAALFALLWTGFTIAPFIAVATQSHTPLTWAPYNSPDLQNGVKLAVAIDPAPAVLPEPGGPVTFTVKIANDARREPVRVTELLDSLYGDVTKVGRHGILSTKCQAPQEIERGGEYSCSFVATVTGNANEHRSNTLSVYIQDRNRAVLAEQASAVVTITDLPSTLAVKKLANLPQVPASGAEVTYTIWITNTSQVDRVQINRLLDDRFGNVSNHCQQPLPVSLPVAGALTCTFSRLLQGPAGTKHTNTATAIGIDDDGIAVRARDRTTVIFDDAPAALRLSAAVTPAALPEVGGPLTYTLQIGNESKLATLAITELTDTLGKVNATCQPIMQTPLKAGEVMTCRYVRTMQGEFNTVFMNPVTVSGSSEHGEPVTATAATQVSFLDTPASLGVQKLPNRAIVPSQGGIVTFTVQVNNTSPVDSLTIDQISDSIYGNVATNNSLLVATTCTTPQTLPVGGQYTCQFSALLSGAAGAVHTNLLTVAATDDDNLPLQAQASASVALGDALLHASKRASLLQDRNGDGLASPGDTIGYSVLITNAGQVADTFTFTDQPDNHTRLIADQVTSTQGAITIRRQQVRVNLGLLAPGSVAAINFPVVVVNPLPGEVSQVSNQGLVVGEITPALLTDDPTTAAVDDPTVTPVVAQPRLVATKVVGLATDADGDGLPSPGDTISYTIRITNGGNQAARSVVLADPLDRATALLSGSVVSSQGQVSNDPGNPALVTVQLGDLAVGAMATVHFQAQVANPLPAAVGQISNQGVLTGVNITPSVTDDPTTAAADDPTRLFLAAAPLLQLSKRDLIFADADGDNVVSAGDTLLYTLRLSNLGQASARDILIADTPDVGTTLIVGKVQANGGQILAGNAPGDRTVSLLVSELLPQQRVDLAFRVTVNPGGAAALVNQATVRYSSGQSGGQADLTFVSDDPDTPQADDPTTTPLSRSLPAESNRAFLPLVRR